MQRGERSAAQSAEVTDGALVGQALAGDERAFESLVHRYDASLFARMYPLHGGQRSGMRCVPGRLAARRSACAWMLCPSERVRTPGDERIPGASRAEKEDPMNHIDDKEAIELLRKAGCTALEIERLRRLRREYAEKEKEMRMIQESFLVQPHAPFRLDSDRVDASEKSNK